MKKNLFILLPILILIISGCSLPWQAPEKVSCTMEAKLCPDGTAVGRGGPNCEFAPCPGENQPGGITNFKECAAAGNPVMESYPRQCRAGNQTFVEELSAADQDKLKPSVEPTCKDLCGDGICQEIVCLAIGCPCAENRQTCPQDCQ